VARGFFDRERRLRLASSVAGCGLVSRALRVYERHRLRKGPQGGFGLVSRALRAYERHRLRKGPQGGGAEPSAFLHERTRYRWLISHLGRSTLLGSQ
jgi:hypothetical protein